MTFTRSPIRAAALAAGVLALAAATGLQAQTWPDKTIKLIAPSQPGGPPDVYARALGEFLSKQLGQPVVVENQPAAGGMIAAQSIMRAPADGHTLLVNTAGMMTITPNANPRANYKGTDFTQICQGVDAALVLATHPSVGAKNAAELAQWVKAQKPSATYTSYSPGSPAHFLGYQFSEVLKTEMTHIPYKSSPQQITDMIAGVAPLGFVQIATAAPQIKAGKLVAYAQTGEKRSPQLPEVPTVAEVGWPQLTTTVWFGLAGNKNLPPAVVKRLTELHQQLTASPEFKTRMVNAGLTVSENVCGQAFDKKIAEETQRWGRVVKATGFVAE